MSAPRALKRAFLGFAGVTGLGRMTATSDWRRQRLLVLCWHGLSLSDEHDWRPELYMPPDLLRRRLALVRELGCTVLSLGEGLSRLRTGTLPPRAVALTFDDGAVDFARCAVPILEEFGFPATVYLTSHYCLKQLPVFDIAASYVAWKGRAAGVVQAEGLPGLVEPFDVGTPAGRTRAVAYLRTATAGWSSERRDDVLRHFTRCLGVDDSELRGSRLLHIMAPHEVQALPADLVAVELHTHRHRTPVGEGDFRREIEDNRRVIEEITGRRPMHFCYPSGDYRARYPDWLRTLGVASATTCVPGLVTPAHDSYLLPRLVDTSQLTDREFVGWLTGVSELLPRRASTGAPPSTLSADP